MEFEDLERKSPPKIQETQDAPLPKNANDPDSGYATGTAIKVEERELERDNGKHEPVKYTKLYIWLQPKRSSDPSKTKTNQQRFLALEKGQRGYATALGPKAGSFTVEQVQGVECQIVLDDENVRRDNIKGSDFIINPKQPTSKR